MQCGDFNDARVQEIRQKYYATKAPHCIPYLPGEIANEVHVHFVKKPFKLWPTFHALSH